MNSNSKVMKLLSKAYIIFKEFYKFKSSSHKGTSFNIFVLILPIQIYFTFFLCSCNYSNYQKIPPLAKQGILDLSGWDFSVSSLEPTMFHPHSPPSSVSDSNSDKELGKENPILILGSTNQKKRIGESIIKLDGEWEFYWEELPEFDERGVVQLSENNKNFFKVPGAWNGRIVQKKLDTGEIQEKKIESFGYATYRLKIILPEIMPVGLRIPEMGTNYKLLYNNRTIIERGKVGVSRETSISEKSTNYILFIPEANEFFLTLLVSNFESNKGGFYQSILLGDNESILSLKQKNIAVALFVVGILFIMGIYHIALYYLKKDDLSTLYFALFSLMMCLRMFVTEENFLIELIPTINFVIFKKLEFLSLFFGVTLFNEFISEIFQNEINLFIRKLVTGISIFYTLIALFLSPYYFTKLLVSFQILLIFFIIYAIFIFIKAILHKRLGGKTFLTGFIVFAAVTINDILHTNYIFNTGFLSPYGFIFFIFSQSFLLTSRFANTFHQVKDLSDNLEKKVEERTRDLEESKILSEKALQESNNLNQMIQVIIQSKNIDEMFMKIFELFSTKFGLTSYLMYSLDSNKNILKFHKLYGNVSGATEFIKILHKNDLSIDHPFCIHGASIKKKKPIFKRNIQPPHPYKIEEENIIEGGCTSIYIIPLINDEAAFGTISFSDNKFERSSLNKLTRKDREEIENFIKLVSPSIYQSHQKQEIQNAFSDLTRLKSELEIQKSQIERIQEMSREIQLQTDFHEMLKTLESILWESYKVGDYTIWIYHPESNELKSLSLSSHWKNYELNDKIKNIPMDGNRGIHQLVFEKKRSFFLQKFKNISSGSEEDFNRELLGMESIFAIPCIVNNESFAVLSIADLRPEYSRDPSIRAVKHLTPKQRNEIEQLVALIANPLYQSLQKQQIQKAYQDLKETQDQLIEAERLASLGQLVGGIAHEINNPISVIRSHVEILEINNRTSIEEIPRFIDSLTLEEKNIFYSIVITSLDQKEFLTTKKERKLRKDLLKNLENLIREESLRSTVVDHLTILRLPPPYEDYLETLGSEKFQKFLSMAEVFKSRSNSLSSIEISVEKASRVIFALRSYLNTGLNSEKKVVDLVSEIEKALRVYDNYLVGKIHIRKEFPKDLPYLCTSENLIQVWKNIIFNSIQGTYNTNKYLEISIQKMESLPTILKNYRTSSIVEDSLSGKPTIKQWILVRFLDSGIGIPPELQEKVFTPFFTTKSTGEGIGLGLYTCKKIIHEHGGAIFFKSEPGSTEFIVVLPE